MLLKWMIHRKLSAFEREHGYDASYMHEVARHGFRGVPEVRARHGIGSYRKDVPTDVHCAAGLTSSIQADCGPCTQLGVGLALRAGVPARDDRGGRAAATRRRCRRRSRSASGSRARCSRATPRPTRAARRSCAAGARAPCSRWRSRIMAAQLYPTLKYALGHGKAVHAGRGRRRAIAPLRHAPRPHDRSGRGRGGLRAAPAVPGRAWRTACSARSPRPRTSCRTRSCAGARRPRGDRGAARVPRAHRLAAVPRSHEVGAAAGASSTSARGCPSRSSRDARPQTARR